MSPPVSIVIPMYNAERHIKNVLEAIFDQDYPGAMEVIIVNDGSRDRSLEIVKDFQIPTFPPLLKGGERGVKIIDQPNQGAVAATNNGFKAARYDIICSIDSDVVIYKDWLTKIAEEFDDLSVGAVQGFIKTPEGVPFLIRMAGYDLEYRYERLRSKHVTQVSTANTAYRKSAIEKAGLFNPEFIYGYDNDMSYRLQKAGYKLVFRKDAFCDHYWKADIRGYIRQQYWSAYGRMQLIQRHRERVAGDTMSGLRMIMQVPMTLLFILLFTAGIFFSMFHNYGRYLLLSSFGIIVIMLIDRLAFAAGIFKKQRDSSVFLLPFVHILRNMVWCWAFFRWGLKI